MTISANTLKKGTISGEGIKSVALPILHSVAPIAQGDLVFLDTGAHILKPVAVDADAATLCGVALSPSAPTSNIDNGTAPLEKGISVGSDGVFELKTTASEVYHTGDAVYIGADAQTVTLTVGTNKVGTVLLPTNVSLVTGAAGIKVQVVIKSKLY